MSFADCLSRALTRQARSATALSSANAGQAAPEIGVGTNSNAPPYDGVVTVYDTKGGQDYQGTGVLISPDEVLTASHLLYTTGEAPATGVEIVVGGSSIYPDGSGIYQADGIHYNAIDDGGDDISGEASQSDYAVIHLAEPVQGRTIFDPLSNYEGGVATVAGYPGTANGDLQSDTAYFQVDPDYTLLDGPALGPGSSGGPVFVDGADGQVYVAGVVSSYDLDDPTYGYDALITQTAFDQIESWVSQDDGTSPSLAAFDTTRSQSFDPHGTVYSGPVAGLAEQYINVTPDNLNVTAATNNWFIHSGAGEDALAAHGGINVLDGGTGSNFLVGGTGAGSMDTFYTDDRGATASIWDTIVNFHKGDAATLFGVTQSGFTFAWADGEGAAGWQGLTLHATAPGKPEASITLAGYTSAALTDGHLTVSFGTTNGTPYLYIHGNS